MFDNIGGKLKSLAQVECWVGIVLFSITGLLEMDISFFSGVLTIGLGVLGSWLSSLVTYGVGEAVETAQANKYQLQKLQKQINGSCWEDNDHASRTTQTSGKAWIDLSSPEWVCATCGATNNNRETNCHRCGMPTQ